MVVDRFSDVIVENPKLQENPWLCQQAGGPFLYTSKELGEAHRNLRITSEEFDEVGAEIARALNAFNVPEREKQEVLAAIVARKDEVVSPSS